jgi:hypothetical protein
MMDDLFGYPDSPGFKEKGGTSEAAAELMAPRAATLCAKALEILRVAYPDGRTADEIASSVRVTVLAMRPRITELYLAGLIEKTCERRKNISGASARVWAWIPRRKEGSHEEVRNGIYGVDRHDNTERLRAVRR